MNRDKWIKNSNELQKMSKKRWDFFKNKYNKDK